MNCLIMMFVSVKSIKNIATDVHLCKVMDDDVKVIVLLLKKFQIFSFAKRLLVLCTSKKDRKLKV